MDFWKPTEYEYGHAESNIRNRDKYGDKYDSPCAHDNCSSCHGTGRKPDGSMCIHMIACQCRKCSVWC